MGDQLLRSVLHYSFKSALKFLNNVVQEGTSSRSQLNGSVPSVYTKHYIVLINIPSSPHSTYPPSAPSANVPTSAPPPPRPSARSSSSPHTALQTCSGRPSGWPPCTSPLSRNRAKSVRSRAQTPWRAWGGLFRIKSGCERASNLYYPMLYELKLKLPCLPLVDITQTKCVQSTR